MELRTVAVRSKYNTFERSFGSTAVADQRAVRAVLRPRVLCCAPGVEEFLPLGHLNELEQAGLEALKPELLSSIQKGIDFVTKSESLEKPISFQTICCLFGVKMVRFEEI